jgi:hypothetical protein
MLSATLRQTQRNSPRIADHRSSRAFRFVPFVQAAPSPRVHLAGWKDTCFPHSRQTPIPTRSARGDRDCNCSNHDCQQRSRKLRAKRHRTAPDRTDRRRLPSVWAGTGRTARPASRDHQASRSDVLATASGKGVPSIRHRDRSAREARHVHNPFAGTRCRLGSSSRADRIRFRRATRHPARSRRSSIEIAGNIQDAPARFYSRGAVCTTRCDGTRL